MARARAGCTAVALAGSKPQAGEARWRARASGEPHALIDELAPSECPLSGIPLDSSFSPGQIRRVNPLFEEAVRRLSLTLGLSPEQARRVVLEVFDSMRFDADEYIVSRHAELQARGVANAEIYDRIAQELQALRFRAKPLNARQIRRRIYG